METGKNKKRSSARVTVLIVACVVVCLVIIYQIFSPSLMRTQLRIPFGFGAAEVLSGSMEPTFSQGDMIFIAVSSSYEVGDIVVFDTGEGFVVHRIMEINGDTVIVKGDANNAPDDPIDISDIKAKTLFWIPRLGRIAKVLKAPLLFISAIACVLSVIRRRPDDTSDSDEAKKQKELLEEIERLKKLSQ